MLLKSHFKSRIVMVLLVLLVRIIVLLIRNVRKFWCMARSKESIQTIVGVGISTPRMMFDLICSVVSLLPESLCHWS